MPLCALKNLSMHNVKKILPVLYPTNQDMNRKWFIKYRTECYTTGKLIYKKYTGALNLESDAEKRMALAQQYMQAMQRGEPLPNVQGQRHMHPTAQAKGFATVVQCTADYMQQHTHALRHSTRLHYKSKIKILCTWLHASGQHQLTIGAMHAGHVQQFVQWLKQHRKLSNTTCNDYKHILSTIWQQFVRDKKISENPFAQVKDLRSDTQHLVPYTTAIERTMLHHMPGHNPQLWLFLQFVYYCALRPGQELRLLKLHHIDFEHGTVTVPGTLAKNYRTRTTNIPHILMQQIMHWQHLPAHYYLFSTDNAPGAVALGKNYFGRKFAAFRKAYNIDSTYKLYASKHTMNTKMAMLFNAVVLQHHNGHASLAETQKYIGEISHQRLQFLQTDLPKFGQ